MEINERLDKIDCSINSLTEELHVWRAEQREICFRHSERANTNEERLSDLEDITEENENILHEHSYALSIGKWLVGLMIPILMFLVGVGLFQWFQKGNSIFEVPKTELRVSK